MDEERREDGEVRRSTRAWRESWTWSSSMVRTTLGGLPGEQVSGGLMGSWKD